MGHLTIKKKLQACRMKKKLNRMKEKLLGFQTPPQLYRKQPFKTYSRIFQHFCTMAWGEWNVPSSGLRAVCSQLTSVGSQLPRCLLGHLQVEWIPALSPSLNPFLAHQVQRFVMRNFKRTSCDVRDLNPIKLSFILGKVKGKTKKPEVILFWKQLSRNLKSSLSQVAYN